MSQPRVWFITGCTSRSAGEPPLRLALGADAVDAIRAKHERLRAELDRWEDVACATTFDD